MQTSYEIKTYRKPNRTPVRILSPPLSPPPTSPLPPPPSDLSRKYVDRTTFSEAGLRSQTSLPDLTQQRPSSSNSYQSSRGHDGGFRHPRLPQNFGTSSLKSSSDSDLPALSKFLDQSCSKATVDSSNDIADKYRNRTPLSQTLVRLSGGRWSSSLPSKRREISITLPRNPKMNRSKRPPRKAIARSALYIPLGSGSKRTPTHASNDVITTPSSDNDKITSLPRCPSGDDLGRVLQTDRFLPRDRGYWHRGTASCSLLDHSSSMPISPPINSTRRKLSKPRSRQFSKSDQKIHPTAVSAQRSDPESVFHLPGAATTEKKPNTPLVPSETDAVEVETFDLETSMRRRPWHARHRRLLWILLTVVVVLLATAGVVGGLLWRLTHK